MEKFELFERQMKKKHGCMKACLSGCCSTVYAGTRGHAGERKNPPFPAGFFIKAGTNLLSPVGTTIGLAGFTAEFGMGSGFKPPVWAPARPGDRFRERRTSVLAG